MHLLVACCLVATKQLMTDLVYTIGIIIRNEVIPWLVFRLLHLSEVLDQVAFSIDFSLVGNFYT